MLFCAQNFEQTWEKVICVKEREIEKIVLHSATKYKERIKRISFGRLEKEENNDHSMQNHTDRTLQRTICCSMR